MRVALCDQMLALKSFLTELTSSPSEIYVQKISACPKAKGRCLQLQIRLQCVIVGLL